MKYSVEDVISAELERSIWVLREKKSKEKISNVDRIISTLIFLTTPAVGKSPDKLTLIFCSQANKKRHDIACKVQRQPFA